MSDDQDKEQKTEDASEQKIKDALEKGQTPVSKELSIFFSLLVILAVTVFTMSGNMAATGEQLAGLLDRSGEIHLVSSDDIMELANVCISIGIIIAAPFFVGLMLAGIASSVSQNPPSIVWKRVTPQLSRISLSKGRERIFSGKGFIEFLKSVAKVGISIFIVYLLTSNFIEGLITGLYTRTADFLNHLQIELIGIVSAILVTMTAITAVDIFISRKQWLDDLKMTKQEVKDEIKQAMGDPLLRSRQRSMALDRSRNRMMAAVPTATVIIANPTHFSVALRYRPDEDPAPMVVAMGQDIIALRIREIAKDHEVPVIENVQLARGLYKISKVDQPIPPEFFQSVAQIIAFLRNQTAKSQKMGLA
ncbi:EscU/YscU/HrcU family type III secretion system export apparatus switch protein [Ahrensia marina]|uniref:Flagellar biosynthetic protein FlhB n=1 Tax=Ahrensia marina TaxID=1514904 RepID=A0A0N0E732_9HYPH|nr:flagellar type III secretion system protein FlhB [Ahrensia marina]KPB00715.1 hypothetical protein SU32_11880 [Ahrensia marina]